MSLSITDVTDIMATPGNIASYLNYTVGEVNNHVIKMSIMTQDYFWHYHPNSDETFLVLEGVLLLDLETGTLELNKGQLITVPRMIPHRTRPVAPQSINLTFELKDIETIRIDR